MYELALILRSSLSETQRKKVVDVIKGLLKDLKIAKEDEWGLKVLSYPIKKETSGYYLLYSLESDNGISADVERKIQGNENVLRHLLVRKK